MNASRLRGRMRAFLGWFVLLALVAGATAGCGGKKAKTATAEGKVTYKNKPVTGGTIRFYPASGQTVGGASAASQAAAQGTIKGDGTFMVPSIPMGDYRVAIETESVKGMGNMG